MLATILTAADMASKVNWTDAARKLSGRPTIAQNAAKCLDELVDLDVIDQYLAEHDDLQRRLESYN